MRPASLPFDRTNLVPGSRVCVAVSGGADSVALLCALDAANRLPKHPLGVGLSAVHIHHGLRAEQADADAAFVQTLCSRLHIPLHLHRVDVPAHRVATGETIEEAGRTLRYQVFHTILSTTATDDLFTAHTRDDQAETVLMKLLRGAWTEGLSGIHPILATPDPAKRILRPLLATTRSQIVAYLQQTGQPWREDASNADSAHTRNRLRHHILPMLRIENPSLDQTLANLAELAREEEAHWQAALPRLLPQILLPGLPARGGGRSTSTAAPTVSLDIDRLRPLSNATRRRLLRAAARSLGPESTGGPPLSFDQTTHLLALCGFSDLPNVPSRSGAVLRLSHGLTAKRLSREINLSLETTVFSSKMRAKQ